MKCLSDEIEVFLFSKSIYSLVDFSHLFFQFLPLLHIVGSSKLQSEHVSNGTIFRCFAIVYCGLTFDKCVHRKKMRSRNSAKNCIKNVVRSLYSYIFFSSFPALYS